MEHILTLDELGRKFGTDKSSQAHNYLAVYEQFLAPYRANADLGVLEIGVRDGPSVRVWQEYFPAAQIVGVDISESCRAHADTRIAIEINLIQNSFKISWRSTVSTSFSTTAPTLGAIRLTRLDCFFPIYGPAGFLSVRTFRLHGLSLLRNTASHTPMQRRLTSAD
jgi:hypothetical protein